MIQHASLSRNVAAHPNLNTSDNAQRNVVAFNFLRQKVGQWGGHSVKLFLVGQLFRHSSAEQHTSVDSVQTLPRDTLSTSSSYFSDTRYRRATCVLVDGTRPTTCKDAAPFPYLLDGHHQRSTHGHNLWTFTGSVLCTHRNGQQCAILLSIHSLTHIPAYDKITARYYCLFHRNKTGNNVSYSSI